MLFLFRGRYGNAAKAVIGAVLLAVGLAIHGGVVLVVIGAVLIAWAAASVLKQLRTRGQDTAADAAGDNAGDAGR